MYAKLIAILKIKTKLKYIYDKFDYTNNLAKIIIQKTNEGAIRNPRKAGICSK
jgi:hypothetical protein